MVAVTVLVSAFVDFRVVEKTPPTPVVPVGAARVLALPVLASDTAWPTTPLPLASWTVRVSVVQALPSATTEAGLATSVEVALLGGPTVKVTAAVAVAAPKVAVTVLASALVE